MQEKLENEKDSWLTWKSFAMNSIRKNTKKERKSYPNTQVSKQLSIKFLKKLKTCFTWNATQH